jgi:hypothetical protein
MLRSSPIQLTVSESLATCESLDEWQQLNKTFSDGTGAAEALREALELAQVPSVDRHVYAPILVLVEEEGDRVGDSGYHGLLHFIKGKGPHTPCGGLALLVDRFYRDVSSCCG